METKQDFLNGLRRALTGRMRPLEVEEHIKYYDEYITAEMRRGRAESEVLEALGNPSLIAMSICDANKAGGQTDGEYDSSGYTQTQYQTYEEAYGRDRADEKDGRPFLFRHPKLAILLAIIVILIVVGLGIWLTVSLVSFFWPIIVTIVVAILLIRLIVFIRRNW